MTQTASADQLHRPFRFGIGADSPLNCSDAPKTDCDTFVSRRREIVNELHREYKPETETARQLISQLGSSYALIEIADCALPAILRRGGEGTSQLISGSGQAKLRDAELAGSLVGEEFNSWLKNRRWLEQSINSNLARLESMCESESGAARRAIRPRFSSENGCHEYLVTRLEKQNFACPNCQSNSGRWLRGRPAWQCKSCERFLGLRTGTILEGSKLPLLDLFTLIELVLTDATMSTRQLGNIIGRDRLQTVRKIKAAIISANKSTNRSKLLAGLDQIFGQRNSSRNAASYPRCQLHT